MKRMRKQLQKATKAKGQEGVSYTVRLIKQSNKIKIRHQNLLLLCEFLLEEPEDFQLKADRAKQKERRRKESKKYEELYYEDNKTCIEKGTNQTSSGK